jgi:hypothetical protein
MKETTEILDSAYELAKKAYTAASHAEAKDSLHARFPSVNWDDLVEAYMRGCDLAEKCYEVAEKARREGIPDQKAIGFLAERFPGFSVKTYNDALTRGWFLSR